MIFISMVFEKFRIVSTKMIHEESDKGEINLLTGRIEWKSLENWLLT